MILTFKEFGQQKYNLPPLEEGIRHMYAGWLGDKIKDKFYNTIDKMQDTPIIRKTVQAAITPIASVRGSRLKKKFHYDDEQQKAIQHYTDFGSKNVNKALATNKWSGWDNDKKTLIGMSRAIKSNKAGKDLHVYTGLGDNRTAHLHKEMKSKGHVGLPTFTSTSLSKNIARTFSTDKTLLKIHVPADAHTAYVNHHSSNKGEHEVVLHPNAKIKVNPNPSRDLLGHKTYHAKLTHDGIKPTRFYHDEE